MDTPATSTRTLTEIQTDLDALRVEADASIKKYDSTDDGSAQKREAAAEFADQSTRRLRLEAEAEQAYQELELD